MNDKKQKILFEILDYVSEDILVIDKNFKITYANKAILDTLNLKKEDVIGNYCYKITHHLDKPCQPPEHKCPVEEFYKTKEPITLIHRHFDRNNNPFFTEVVAYPIKDKWKGVTAFIHISRMLSKDISQKLKDMERIYKFTVGRELKMIELKKRVEELEERLKEKIKSKIIINTK
jgi:PAS domain S-box-containing protein